MTKDRHAKASSLPDVTKDENACQRDGHLTNCDGDSIEQRTNHKSTSPLTSAEYRVLDVFRTYLMAPGQMLCFNSSVFDSLSAPLAQLTDKGFLVVERYPGGYSLTKIGFAAMKDRQ